MGTPVTVSFDAGGGSEVESQTIAKNSIAAEPTAPTCAGCVFTGWYLNGEAYDFGTPVTEDLTLSAEFEFDQAAVNEVIAKIDAIGEVEYTEACKAKIDAAREAYNALTDAQKELVSNYATLTAAESRYAELKAAAETPTDPTDPGNTTEPTDPDTPAGDNICKWDNVDHGTSIWGRIVRFFHAILYFFAHLFEKK